AERTNQQIPDFEYDDYGNLVLNRDKEIQEIRYNHLNLPTKISFTNNREISYFYDASGVKIKKEVNDGTQINTTAYQDGFQYSNNLLEFFPTAEGYVKTTRQSSGYDFNYVFNHTDHLGNIRLRYTQHPETGATEILQEDHYYPFGLKHKGYNNEHFVFSLESNDGITLVPATLTAGDGYKYKYQGQEHQDEFGLNWDSFKWRNYSPDLGRFWVVDPLADHPKQVGTSPYAFVANNPLRYIDPTGMIWEDPKQAEKLNTAINNRIERIDKNSEKIQAKIDQGGLSDKKLARLEGRLSENSQKTELLNQSLSDIEAIGNAAETYRLTGPSANDGTHGVVKGADGVINIEGSNTGLHIHEIRHVGQSIEAGGVRFNKDGRLLNAATTLEGARNNEINAYQTQYSFDGSYPGGASSLKDINSTSLMNIKTSDGRTVYEILKDKKK